MADAHIPSEKQVLDLHCAHGKPVYARCERCEDDVKAGTSNGFTKPEALPKDVLLFHCIYTEDEQVRDVEIEADSFASAERIFKERFPCAGWYEIGVPLSAFGVIP